MKNFWIILVLCILIPNVGHARASKDPHNQELFSYGSFRKSCSDVRWFFDSIRATCMRRDGRPYAFSEIDLKNAYCDDIINDNGTLRCVKRERRDHRRRNDSGYNIHIGGKNGIEIRQNSNRTFEHNNNLVIKAHLQRTCRNISIHNNVISATCRTRNGGWRDSSLRLDKRRCAEISNQDGILTCH